MIRILLILFGLARGKRSGSGRRYAAIGQKFGRPILVRAKVLLCFTPVPPKAKLSMLAYTLDIIERVDRGCGRCWACRTHPGSTMHLCDQSPEKKRQDLAFERSRPYPPRYP